jgi:hypothetical protein
MPFDEQAHEPGGGGDGHRSPPDSYVTAALDGVVLSAKLSKYCVACCMWAIGKTLVATHMALTIRALEHKRKRDLTDEESAEIVADAVQEICDAFSDTLEDMIKKDKERRHD